MKIQRRKSKQREKIYESIKASIDHPTAQQVYDSLKKEMPFLSLGNVYRNIKILVEENRIICSKFDDGIEHYDAITEIHYHFICEKCKSISDFPMPIQENITKKAQKTSNHAINSHTIQFFGICESCKMSEVVGKKQMKTINIKGGKNEKETD